jgi:DUF1365 family protein
MSGSALYAGAVVHARLRPVRHRLRYRMQLMLLDLDELPALDRRLRLFGYNRRGLLSFHDADHGNGLPGALRAHVEGHLRQAGIDPVGGRIAVLCMPRLMGMVFNPISVFLCHDADNVLRAVLYEVNNTFGQRHTYLVPVEEQGDRTVRQHCDKHFFVSPFMEMRLSYAFRLSLPADKVSLAIDAHDAAGPILFAAFTGRQRLLNDRALLIAFLGQPLQALRVFGAIHWEALKLWVKGLRLHDRPPAPADPVTIVNPGRSP